MVLMLMVCVCNLVFIIPLPEDSGGLFNMTMSCP